jgi:hypothetical protein
VTWESVTVSSLAHRQGGINSGNLTLAHGYRPGAAYSRPKLASLLLTYELQRRLWEESGRLTSVTYPV